MIFTIKDRKGDIMCTIVDFESYEDILTATRVVGNFIITVGVEILNDKLIDIAIQIDNCFDMDKRVLQIERKVHKTDVSKYFNLFPTAKLLEMSITCSNHTICNYMDGSRAIWSEANDDVSVFLQI
jgi:hypothetical protein